MSAPRCVSAAPRAGAGAVHPWNGFRSRKDEQRARRLTDDPVVAGLDSARP